MKYLLTIVFIYFFFLFVDFINIGSFRCWICFDNGIFNEFPELEHLHSHYKCHGPTIFPFVCAVCPIKYNEDAAYFRTGDSMAIHWKTCHLDIALAKDIIHPVHGSHYSYLRFKRLAQIPDSLGQIITTRKTPTNGIIDDDSESDDDNNNEKEQNVNAMAEAETQDMGWHSNNITIVASDIDEI